MNDLHTEAIRFQNIADQALENGDALGAYVYLHQLEKIVGEAKKQIQDAAIEERERFGRKEEITRHGFLVSIMETSRFESVAYWGRVFARAGGFFRAMKEDLPHE